jgi:hypothetical protein
VASRSHVQVALRLVHPLVAAAAIELERLGVREDFMRDRPMTQLTLEIVLAEMHLVHTGGIVVSCDPLRFVVASVAPILVGRPVARGHPVMARNAGHQVANVLRMVDDPALGLDPRRLDVTARAARDGLALRASAEVTQEAGALRDRDVISLHDLRVAARASELLAAPQVREVLPVVEPHSEERELTLQLPGGMTAGSQARGVLDLGPRSRSVRARDVLYDLVRGLHLSHRLGPDSGGVVTPDARHAVMRGGGPGIVVRLHVVAVGAEAGLGAVLDEPHGPDAGQEDQEDERLDDEAQPSPSPGGIGAASHLLHPFPR